MAVAIDTPHLGAYLSVPETSLQTLIEDPTAELVASLLRQVSVKAKEHEQERADRLKLEVELENAVRNAETKSRAQKAATDKSAAHVATLRRQVHDEEVARSNVEKELQSLKGSVSATDHDASTLKARISSVENSNRDLSSLLQSKTNAYDEAANDLIIKQQRINELRAEVSRQEQASQAASSASTVTKLREQTLQQEVGMLRRNNDWLDTELKTKNAEYTKFRKEKNGQISELQRQNEEITMQVESQQRNESTLHTRIEETTEKIDQLLLQIKDLREEAGRNTESHRAELDSANRLAKLMEESRDTEKARLQDIASQLDLVKDEAAEELGRLAAEIETEHQDRLAAEDRIADLESQLEQLRSQSNDAPSTPKNGLSGSRRGTPGPDATPSKRSANLTQMVSDYHTVKSELDAEKRRSAELRKTMDEMLQDIEARQPEIAEMQADHSRMEKDLLEMSNYAEKVAKESEEAKKNAKGWERQMQGLAREGDILRQQLRDLSSQVKILLMEVNVQSAGSAPFTAEQRAQLESLAQGDLDSDMAQEVTDTSRFISQHLTTFRNIAELTDQNTKLLRLTRELGEKMEGEEAQAQRSQATQTLEELEILRQKYERAMDEISSLTTQSESYIKERDMFRRMLSHRGQLPRMSEAGDMFNESVNGHRPGTPTSNFAASQLGQSPSSKDIEDHRKLLKEMQTHFDSYRQEAASERSVMKTQLEHATRKSADLRNELSKRIGELTLANERYEMLQGNFKMLKAENAELQKRSTTMSERASKQDLRAQQVAEELVEARGIVESMRNESANLRAEKEFWKSVETRLTADNGNLQADRDRLNAMNANLQNLLNETEHAHSERRRRLEAQVENLESETKTLKRKLQEEQEEHRRLSMRREHETSQTQTRTDELFSSLAATREELVAAKTTRDHLHSRVDELVIELRSAVEKVDVLQQKPSIAVGSGDGSQATNGAMTTEQELAMQVSELRKNLDLVQAELTSAYQQIEQYKAISSGSEEELRSFNESHEQYRQEMDTLIEEKETRLKLLEQDLDNLRAELAARNTELNEVRAENLQSDHRLEEQKASYELEINKLTDLRNRAESAAQYHQQDLKSQAEIAQNAQQNYENELLKHAEAAKTLQFVRNEYNELKLRNMETVAKAETAESNLAQNWESWTDSKERYERELADMRNRREDLSAQNRILHEQLENLSTQITSLQSTNSANGTSDEDIPGSNNDDITNLQELVRYLRREKDIVDVQHDLASQEARRLRQQLEHTQSQLEETRLKLSQQRRSEETSELHAMSHKKLIDTIEELNLNRESNSTLRTEKTQMQTSLNEKSQQVEELQNQITPLQARISELEDQHDALEQELRMTSEARARFEQRYLDVLNRSNSIDPAEVEKLQQQLQTIQSERDTLSQERVTLQTQVDGIPEQIKESLDDATKRFQESRQKLIEQSKARDGAQKAKINEKDAALNEAVQEKAKLESQLQELQTSLDNARQELADQVERAQEEAQTRLEAQTEQSKNQRDDAKQTSNKDNQGTDDNTQSMSSATADPSAEAQELQKRVQAAESQVASANAKIKELEESATTTQLKLDEAQALVTKLQSEQSTTTHNESVTSSTTDANEASLTVEELRRELAETQRELEEKSSELLSRESAGAIQTGEGSASVEEQIKSRVEEIQAELRRRHEERVSQVEQSYKSRADSMRLQLSKKLAESKSDISKRLEANHAEAVSKLELAHAQKIRELEQRHEEEVQELRRLTVNPDTTGSKDEITKNDGEVQTSDFLTQLSESEIKKLLQDNEVARRIVVNSLKNRETKVKDEQTKIWTEKMAETETKARQAQEQAVNMEGKRLGVKMSMAENRAKAANAKIDVVQQAAKDTPERPVGEVWEVAKVAKPAPTITASSNLQQSIYASPVARKTEAPTGAQTQTTSSPAKANANADKPAGAEASPTAPAVATSASGTASSQIPNGTSSAPTQPAKPASAPVTAAIAQASHTTKPSTTDEAPKVTEQGSNKTADGKPKALDQLLSNTKAAPARRASQSAIPVPGGRGSGIPQPGGQRGGANRGRGRGGATGIGRGGPPGVNTAAAQNSSQQHRQQSASPRTMNAGAKQFVPKTRKRDAEGAGLEGSVHASDTKRPKAES